MLTVQSSKVELFFRMGGGLTRKSEASIHTDRGVSTGFDILRVGHRFLTSAVLTTSTVTIISTYCTVMDDRSTSWSLNSWIELRGQTTSNSISFGREIDPELESELHLNHRNPSIMIVYILVYTYSCCMRRVDSCTDLTPTLNLSGSFRRSPLDSVLATWGEGHNRNPGRVRH